ncbi:MAG: universal stress protein [Desulfurivibrionaceae bacterium]|nr:universal stress protein [Desulfobulbales bacterium]MDT8335083.1 universal stress protein [Desulfurivibrionaceae bacterium]
MRQRFRLNAGFEENRIATRLSIRPCVSVADEILKEQDKLRCCIVAVGRRGLSHNEEFILGSTSNRILHHARNCAVMIIE